MMYGLVRALIMCFNVTVYLQRSKLVNFLFFVKYDIVLHDVLSYKPNLMDIT